MIEFQNVSKAFANKKILDHANFTIKDQEFFVLVGPSGSGKTTTLKMINQLVTHSEGKILINNEEISTANLRKLRLSVGYVLQQIALFPNLTVSENIALIPEMKGWDKAKIADRTNELLDLVGLNPKDYAQRQPSELSGGEQQRVGILRAIAANPKIVLMDEPFSALDPISRRQLQIFIKDLQKKMNLTVVFVTHDLGVEFYSKAINDIPGLSAVKPQAAFYIFPKIDREMYKIDNDEQFVLDFLKQEKILLVHGRGFNWKEPDHFRIVYLPRVDELAEIQEKMERFLWQYRK